MSGMEVSLQNNSAVAVAGRQVEKESSEETTLTEVSKDLGHTQIEEKKAEFQSNEKTSVVEQNKTQKSEGNRSVVQSESVEVSANRKVTTSQFSSSQSFSSEETEEYEYED